MGNKIDYEQLLKQVLNVCEELGYAPEISHLKNYNILTDQSTIQKYLKNQTSFKNYQNFCRENGFGFQNDIKIEDKYIASNELTIEQIIFLIKEYYTKNNKYPVQIDFCIPNKLPPLGTLKKILKKNNLNITDLFKMAGNIENINPNHYSYEYWLDKFIEKSNEIGKPIKFHDLKKYNLPDGRWFISNCKNKNVNGYDDFLKHEVNMVRKYNLTKAEVIKIILKMQSKLNRPLEYEDFRLDTNENININILKKHWKTMNEMKKELGLEIIQEDMVGRHKNIEDLKNDILKLCEDVYKKENRKIITYEDINNSDFCLDTSTYCNAFKNILNCTIKDYVNSIGFDMGNCGEGLNHIFKDNEKSLSQYETIFTNYLRNKLGLKYLKDYFRDVRYKVFIPEYKGFLNCDYKLFLNGKTIYIEIAGMLKDYKDWYYNNKTIVSSKSKEKYRQKLTQKEQMLKDNNLEYLILFPKDLNDDNLNKVFEQLNIKAS